MKIKILIFFILLTIPTNNLFGEEFNEHFDPESGNSGDYYLGENDSIIVIYEYANWYKPPPQYHSWCVYFWDNTLPELKEKYLDIGVAKFIFRDYVWDVRYKMGEAVECAGEQGEYYDYGDYLYDHTPRTSLDGMIIDLKNYAKDFGLNTTLFDACLDSSKYFNEVNNTDSQFARDYGFTGTPSFVIKYKDAEKTRNYYQGGFSGLDSLIKELLNEQNIIIAEDNMHINSDTTLYNHTYKPKDPDNNGVIIINSSNVIFDCNGSTITGNGSGYGIYIENFNNVTIKNCNIKNYTYGIYLNNSNDALLENNNLKYNSIGIYSENSSSTITSNYACYNYGYDLFSAEWKSSTGDSNTCYKPDGWKDTCVFSGCSQPCEMICFDKDGDGFNGTTVECPVGTDCDDDNNLTYPGAPELCNGMDDNCNNQVDENPMCLCDLNRDGMIIRDYNDLMTAYKCFLGVQKNCEPDYLNWSAVQNEYDCLSFLLILNSNI